MSNGKKDVAPQNTVRHLYQKGVRRFRLPDHGRYEWYQIVAGQVWAFDSQPRGAGKNPAWVLAHGAEKKGGRIRLTLSGFTLSEFFKQRARAFRAKDADLSSVAEHVFGKEVLIPMLLRNGRQVDVWVHERLTSLWGGFGQGYAEAVEFCAALGFDATKDATSIRLVNLTSMLGVRTTDFLDLPCLGARKRP